ncbi:MAG: 30S ribosomal protein S27ae [Thermoplasmatota archaeon]
MKKREIFKVEGDKIVRLRRNCPKCGDGVFLAEHKDRVNCGTCGYTEFKGSKEKKIEQSDDKTQNKNQ